MAGALAVLLSACASPAAQVRAPTVATQSVVPVARDRDLPLMLIAAEFALQKNDLAGAARGYADAAAISSDPVVAGQATRLARAVKQWPLARASLQRWRQLDPDSAGVLQESAWIALAEGDSERSFLDLERLLEREDASAWRPIAQVLLGAEDKGEAAGLLKRLATPQRLGDSERDWIAMSQLAFKLDDAALADRLSTESLRRFPSAEGYAWSAQLALERGEKERARTQYREALKRDGQSLRLRTGYAALLAEAGDNAGAARALAQGAQTDVIYGARAAYAARADDKALLEALYRDMRADTSPRSGKRLFLLGQVAELIGQDAQAARWYGDVPDSDERWLDAGIRMVVLSDKGGDPAAAMKRIADMRLAVGSDRRETVDLYLLEADLLMRKQRQIDAIAVYSRGLEQLKDEPRLLYARAMAHIDLDDIESGERDLRALLALDPDSADALNALGYTLADRTNRYVEANALIEKAISIKPDEPAIIDSYGWAQYRLGNLDNAVRLLRQAFEKQPDSEVAAHLGEVLWVRGDRAEARRVWEKGREADADNKILLETMKRLTS
jgi:tetratricopeptide (TPR) repeat protein